MLRVALVLSKVKRHAADEPPLRIALAQVRLHAACMVLNLAANERVELRSTSSRAVQGSGTRTPASEVLAEPETPGPSGDGGAMGGTVPLAASAGV